MKVFKFGGTSVGSKEGLANIKKITDAEKEAIVIVSAFSSITDSLLQCCALAANKEEQSYKGLLDEIIERHHHIITESLPVGLQVEVKKKIDALLDELTNILKGIFLVGEVSQKSSDTVVSYGERLSSIIVTAMLDNAVLVDSRDIIKTTPYFSKHVVDFAITNKLILDTISAVKGKKIVIPGFISTDRDSGNITNLGRGGSDYTASIVAAAISAKELYIYTDVDGFMTADPRVIDNAYRINSLSFVEAMELCNFGAKVIYPPTIFPAYNNNIPIIIKNTFNLSCEGTYIGEKRQESVSKKGNIKGISSIDDTALLTVKGLGMVGVIGVNYRIFKSLAKSGISVFLVSQASSENSTSIGIRSADVASAVEALNTEFAQEISTGEIDKIIVDRNLATIAVVSEDIKNCPGVAAKLFETLNRNGINVLTTAIGAAQTNISFVVDYANLKKAISVIHDSFFLSECQVMNLFLCGVGLVGGKLIEQISGQRDTLMENSSLKINVVGISNSKCSIFDKEGLKLDNFRKMLAQGTPTNPKDIAAKIKSMNLYNSVFVDCTASSEVAAIYEELLNSNVSVVTANKIAASGSFERYSSLKETARHKDVKFLFETNVGAGLPIINTIGALRNSGDRIIKLQAVLSGTLNYIFNVLSEEITFSKAVKAAQDAGYAEPDPRIDLSGTDVIRKLTILARESGYAVEQSDVEKNLFVPANYFEGSVEDFWKAVPELDKHFDELRSKMEKENKRLRFIATMDSGKCSVGLQEVDSMSPFFNLEGSNNIILIKTTRYDEYPLQIKGYGAGASVTAAGVFADIISIANIR